MSDENKKIYRKKQDLIDKRILIESLINSTPIPLFYKDKDGIYLGVNQEFEKLLNVKKEHFIGKSVFDIAPKDIALKYHQKDLEVFENPNESQIYECVIEDGKKKYDVIFYKKAYFNSKGRVAGLIGAILDITFRKKNEDKLNDLFKKFDENVIASRTDLAGNIIYASKAFIEISGYKEDELIGKNHNILRHPDMPNHIFSGMWNTIKKGKVWQGQIKNKKKNGGDYWVESNIEPFYENGKHAGYNAIRVDISTKKKLEELNDTLEERVQERTKQLEKKLYFDDLTGLKSNYALLKDVEQCDKIFTSLMLINIDNFQNINILYGFEVGNRVLKEFSKKLNKIGKKYRIYRLYADEFALLKNFDVLSIDEHHKDLIKLKRVISKFSFVIEDLNEEINIDATVGISFAQDDLLATADMALRYAKKHKFGYKVYNSEIDQKKLFQKSVLWKEKINRALDEDRVIPVFQPIVDRNEKTIKYEVLMRIINPDNKDDLISPSLFLQEAINLKLYSKLTIKVIEKTFEIMKNSNKFFSINLSYDDIYNQVIIDFLEEKLNENPNLAKRLCIEILETHEITDFEIMNDFLKKMRRYKVKIAIDDFGVGHSNLSLILAIKPDFLKIDGEFIKNINSDKQSFAMVRSIVTFAKELDIKIIAEFVHSKEVFDVLYLLGIEEFQGYYFSKPLKKID